MPKVSVIIPIYGVEKYIERCVRSLFRQTLEDVEYIFVDDCTKDNSIIILNKLIKEYEGVIKSKKWKIVQDRMPVNSGLPSVRRRGVELATGDFILHCDSDDWMANSMISEMWSYAESKSLDVVICDYFEASDEDNKYVRGLGLGVKNAFIEVFKSDYSWALWNKLFKKELYDNSITFPKANIGEDMALTLQLLSYGKKVGHLNKPLYYYYQNSSSMTQAKTAEQIIKFAFQWRENVCILDHFFKECTDKKISDVIILIKYMVKNSLLPILGDKQYLVVWRELFSEINVWVFFCPYIDLKSKMFFLLTYLGLYPKPLKTCKQK